ncbi:helix-turn-helix domain-containing protein [Brevibacterium sp. JNUCC-42]|nr:helix-turn-helix domain-containing protein [Brevibacterium sp. JNUCC-42]
MSELGHVLKRAREEKGISLNDIQKMTKIQTRYLDAIERGDFHMLPGHFYAKAFIKSYAEAIGLDPNQIVEHYQADLPSQPSQEQVEQLQRRHVVQRRSPFQTGRWVAPTLLTLFIILVVGVVYMALVNRDNTPPTVQRPPEGIIDTTQGDGGVPTPNQTPGQGQVPTTPGTATPPATTTPPDETIPETNLPESDGGTSTLTFESQQGKYYNYKVGNTDKISVTIKATHGACWVQVRDKDSGKKLFEATLQKGEEKTVDAQDTAFLHLGFSPAVEVLINQVPITMSDIKAQTAKFNFTLQKEEIPAP